MRFDYQGEPRSGIGYSFLGPLLLLQRLGLLPAASGHWAEMKREVDTLIACVGEEVATEQNEAKALAYKLHRQLPVIYGGGILAGVARRWKTQLNENAKSWALSEALPEAHHKHSRGAPAGGAGTGRPCGAPQGPTMRTPQRQARYQATAELLEQRGIGFSEVCARGDSPLSQIMTTVLLGDYASCYLAMLNGMDSSPVHAIDAMRRPRMTEGREAVDD